MGRKDDEDKLNADKLLSGSSDTLTKSKDVPAPQAQLGKGRSFLAILLWTFLIISLAYASALYYFKFPLPTDATQARAQIGELQIIISEHLPNFQAASASAQTSGHTPKSSTERAKKSDENFVDAKVDEDITGAQFTHEDLFLDMDRDGSGGLDEDELGQVLKLQGDFKDDESLKKLFRNMDKDGDGKISFQEAEVFEGEAIDGDSRSLLGKGGMAADTLMVAAGGAITAGIGYFAYFFLTQG